MRKDNLTQIHTNLYISDQIDYEQTVRYQEGWSVVHAYKGPYHRDGLGYSGKGAPKHRECYFARRENRLILNLIDPEIPAYIPKQIIDEAQTFIDEQLGWCRKVLVHCN